MLVTAFLEAAQTVGKSGRVVAGPSTKRRLLTLPAVNERLCGVAGVWSAPASGVPIWRCRSG